MAERLARTILVPGINNPAAFCGSLIKAANPVRYCRS